MQLKDNSILKEEIMIFFCSEKRNLCTFDHRYKELVFQLGDVTHGPSIMPVVYIIYFDV